MRFFTFFWMLLLGVAAAGQKDVQLQVAFPLFLRQGDRTELQATVHNRTGTELTGQAELQLTNGQSGESVDGWFQNIFPAQYVTVGAGGSEVLRFPVEVPFLFYNTLAWKVAVRLPHGKDSTKVYNDEATGRMPVLTAKAFKTETALLPPDSTSATLPALLAAQSSEDINHYSLTVNAATDPALLLYQKLKDGANGAGQTTFDIGNRMFAAALLFSKRWAAAWPKAEGAGGRTNEPPNAAWLSIEREQAPWLRGITVSNPKTEFFALAERQQPSGGFGWIPGGVEDEEATLQIIRQLAWLRQLEAIPADAAPKVGEMLAKAVRWLNRQIEAPENKTKEDLPEMLYVRSLLPVDDAYLMGKMQQLLSGMRSDALLPEAKGYLLLGLRNQNVPAHERLFAQLIKDSTFLNYPDAPAMLLLYATAQGFKHLNTNLTQQVLRSEGETGWKAYALLRAFPATTKPLPVASVRLGSQQVSIPGDASFFVKTIKPPFIKSEMGAVQWPRSEAPFWAIADWRYFEDHTADSNITGINKRFFKKRLHQSLQPIEAGAPLHIGDTITVELSVAATSFEKRVLQDSWPAAMESLAGNQQSSTRQYGQIEFFIDRPQAYTFSYDLIVRHAGTFSDGGTKLFAVPSQKVVGSLPAATVYIE